MSKTKRMGHKLLSAPLRRVLTAIRDHEVYSRGKGTDGTFMVDKVAHEIRGSELKELYDRGLVERHRMTNFGSWWRWRITVAGGAEL